jgi:ubiquitin carboxyl-terminal hydrolase 8|uniref:USP domain-containing protein n=1 Tax=viral metagenome TaxID=1070528 RepID=A0A6C0E6I9_9ZZZZ
METEKTGLSGLANLGNTCFINSCMQIFSHTPELNKLLNDDKYKQRLNNKPESRLLVEWDDLRKILWSQNCVIAPGKFLNSVQQIARIKHIDIFTGYSQNDLPEFLLFIIDCFHTALTRETRMTISGNVTNNTDKIAIQCFEMIKKMYSKDYSEIWELFYAIHISEIRSMDNNEILDRTPEPFFIIDLPIPADNKQPSLKQCFDLYTEGEVLEGENAWYNEKTKQKQSIRKKITFWSFPPVLVIDFKRFNARNQKNQIHIDFPLDNLDLSDYVVGYKKKSYQYELYGICNHSGGVMGGHYTSFVKNANGKWYHFNDTSVAEVDERQLVSPKAYCLFYRKKQSS